MAASAPKQPYNIQRNDHSWGLFALGEHCLDWGLVSVAVVHRARENDVALRWCASGVLSRTLNVHLVVLLKQQSVEVVVCPNDLRQLLGILAALHVPKLADLLPDLKASKLSLAVDVCHNQIVKWNIAEIT